MAPAASRSGATDDRDFPGGWPAMNEGVPLGGETAPNAKNHATDKEAPPEDETALNENLTTATNISPAYAELLKLGHKLVSNMPRAKEDVVSWSPVVSVTTHPDSPIVEQRKIRTIVDKKHERRIVINNRTFNGTPEGTSNAASGDNGKITHNTNSYFHYLGTGPVLNDTTSWNISGGKGGISSTGTVETYIGQPPPPRGATE